MRTHILPTATLPLSLLLTMFLAIAGCGEADDDLDPGVEEPTACESYEEPERVGTLQDPALTEASGLCESRRHPGVLYLHNDSGDTPTVYAARIDGTRLGHFTLEDGIHVDWEDIACAPCEIGSENACLYIGDVGDNLARRDTVTVYVAPEPDDPTTDGTLPILRTLTVTYEDGPRDVETLLVHPRSLDVYFVSKFATPGTTTHSVLRVSGMEDGEVVATSVGSVTPEGPGIAHQFTGGDIHPDGTRLLLRTYATVQEHRLPDGEDSTDTSFDEVFGLDGVELPRVIGDDSANQWEAVAYSADGLSVLSTAEGVGAPVYEWGCD